MNDTQAPNPAAEKTILSFFESWDKDGYMTAFKRYMHPEGIWQNTGFPDAKGREEYLGLMEQYLQFSHMAGVKVETTHIASKGNAVLTERIDHCISGDGSKNYSIPLMGVFELDDDGLITRYMDYFDPRKYLAMAAEAGLAAT